MKIFKLPIIVALFLMSVIDYPQVIPINPELLKIRAEISQMVADSTIPSMAVAVIKDGKILWQEAIGYADIEEKEKATIKSIYPLGSVSKSITATGIMHMVNTGEVSLFDNIQNLIAPIQLRDVNGNKPEIKLWQLVSNNAGLNHGYGVFEKGYLPKTQDEIKQFYESTVVVAFTPGEVYHYSNHSFDVAELLISMKSGKSFQDYMNENVFYPLGIKNTYAYPDFNNKNLVSTYSVDLKKIATNEIIYPAGGAGFWSSIKDLTQYVLFHMGVKKDDKVISEKNLKLMHNFRQGESDMFGIGWFNSDGNIYSDGNVEGGNAAISVDFKDKLGIICLLNRTSNDGIADQINGKIKAVFVKPEGDQFKEWRRFYGTPYNLKYDLAGKWDGKIKDPVTLKEIPFGIVFNNEGKIILNLDGQKIELKYPQYNLLQQLHSQFNTSIPGISDKKVLCSMTLQRDHNKFGGYIFYQQFLKHSFYTMPLYVEIKKGN